MSNIPEIVDPRLDVSEAMAELELSFRDCRLELLRVHGEELSEVQVESIRRLGDRLGMVVKNNAAVSSIAADAKKALTVFGWI